MWISVIGISVTMFYSALMHFRLITAKHAKEIDVMMSDDENETVSLHDFLILRSILNDCNYDISPEDRSALDSVITTITI